MLPSQWSGFTLTQAGVQVIAVKERLAAPAIVFVRRTDLPLTPSAELFSDLLRRYKP
jgi:hypothetical protein